MKIYKNKSYFFFKRAGPGSAFEWWAIEVCRRSGRFREFLALKYEPQKHKFLHLYMKEFK